MPSLAETGKPCFVRACRCGLLPQRYPGEPVDAYVARLAREYGVPELLVRENITIG